MDASTLELDAVKFAQLAVQRDQSGRYQEAVFYYRVWGGGGKRRGAVGSQPRGSEVGERSVRVPAGTRGVEKVLNCSCGVS